MADQTRPDAATREAEQREARQSHDAGREPTPMEEEAADAVDPDPSVAEAYEEATERGAQQEGEGRLP
jgi:hypothetical protein